MNTRKKHNLNGGMKKSEWIDLQRKVAQLFREIPVEERGSSLKYMTIASQLHKKDNKFPTIKDVRKEIEIFYGKNADERLDRQRIVGISSSPEEDESKSFKQTTAYQLLENEGAPKKTLKNKLMNLFKNTKID